VDPLELEKNFLSILSKPTVARAVQCTVHLPAQLSFHDTPGESVALREFPSITVPLCLIIAPPPPLTMISHILFQFLASLG
jgi:hypothetical protein